MFFKDDWLSWTYDGVKFGNKPTPQSKFEFQFKKTINRPLKSHKEELLENTRVIRDQFIGPFDLLFSGGLDSEIVLRCYRELKIPINVFIFKYENDYNYHDVRHALRICDELNVTPKVIDFNLKNFFEKDAYDIWKKGYFHKAGRLPHMKMLDYLDNIPIMGDGDPYWVFKDKMWQFELGELNHSQSIYCNIINKTAIVDWYEYSPEVFLSQAAMPRLASVISSNTPNDLLSNDQFKYFLYKDVWPEIVVRPRRNGFEGFGAQSRVTSPDLVELTEFQKEIDKYNLPNAVCYFTRDELTHTFL